jgi:acylphosphatase
MTCLESQLQELQLIQYSLLPGESFSFVLPPEDSRIWASLLHSFNSTVTTALPSVPSPVPQVKFQVKAADARISFEVQFPERYPEDSDIVGAQVPLVSINGEGISRDEHHQWRAFVQEKLAEVQENESDYPIYQLLCMHLLPKLHEDGHSIDTRLSENMTILEQQSTHRLLETADYHALLTSHHLLSPTKRRSLQRWSSELSISGFAKVGYPGVIYAQGSQANVEEFVANVKSMQWLALKVRFVEPTDLSNDEHHQGWSEFQKVGEVVEEMRRRGRDKYITEMGIGSSVLK